MRKSKEGNCSECNIDFMLVKHGGKGLCNRCFVKKHSRIKREKNKAEGKPHFQVDGDACISCDRKWTECRPATKKLCSKCYYNKNKKQIMENDRQRRKRSGMNTSTDVLKKLVPDELVAWVKQVRRRGGWVDEIDIFRMSDFFIDFYAGRSYELEAKPIEYQLYYMWNYLNEMVKKLEIMDATEY